MKINSLTHDAISQRAQKIWETEGQPTGRDTQIWLTAEQQLSEPASTSAARLTSETAAESVVEFHLPSSTSEEAAVRAALQTPESRGTPPTDKTAPQLAATAQVRGASTAQSTTTPRHQSPADQTNPDRPRHSGPPTVKDHPRTAVSSQSRFPIRQTSLQQTAIFLSSCIRQNTPTSPSVRDLRHRLSPRWRDARRAQHAVVDHAALVRGEWR